MYNILYTIDFKKLAHNVPAVYGVLTARIRACVAKTRAGKMCRNNGVGMERSGMT
jgi:hypothetical protein